VVAGTQVLLQEFAGARGILFAVVGNRSLLRVVDGARGYLRAVEGNQVILRAVAGDRRLLRWLAGACELLRVVKGGVDLLCVSMCVHGLLSVTYGEGERLTPSDGARKHLHVTKGTPERSPEADTDVTDSERRSTSGVDFLDRLKDLIIHGQIP